MASGQLGFGEADAWEIVDLVYTPESPGGRNDTCVRVGVAPTRKTGCRSPGVQGGTPWHLARRKEWVALEDGDRHNGCVAEVLNTHWTLNRGAARGDEGARAAVAPLESNEEALSHTLDPTWASMSLEDAVRRPAEQAREDLTRAMREGVRDHYGGDAAEVGEECRRLLPHF